MSTLKSKITAFLSPITSTEKQKTLAPGVYHYQSPPEAEKPYRLHLRMEADGSGILIVNASTFLHLNQTAAEYAYYLVHGSSKETVVNRVSSRYAKISKAQIAADFTDLRDRIMTLIDTPDLEPETYLNFERLEPHSVALSAPLRLDCALTYRTEGTRKDAAPVKRVKRELTTDEWKGILDKAAAAGIPHVLLTGGEPTLRPDLPELVTHIEKSEMVCGLITDGLRLTDPKYLHALLEAGLDHLMIVLSPDHEQSWEAIKDALAEDIHVTVHVTLTPALVKKYTPIFERLASLGVTSVSLSTSDVKFAPQLKEARDLLAMKGLNLVWDMPVPYSDNHPVALESEDAAIPGAGKVWLYLEPDGDVMPAQGVQPVFGNLLEGTWEEIWKNRPGLTPADWHARYLLQAGWTAKIRSYLYQRASLQDARRVLEVGCGSAVICKTLHQAGQTQVVGLDIDHGILKAAQNYDNGAHFVNGDGVHLPFTDQGFDVVVCHYLLLWLKTPVAALKEMARVCIPGGAVLALAEPDHDSRIDSPLALERLGRLQTHGLKKQGANTHAGRLLSGWFTQAGLEVIESGILGGQWKGKPADEYLASEREMLKHDLKGWLAPAEIERYCDLDRAAWVEGSRVLHVPTFYAIGRVK